MRYGCAALLMLMSSVATSSAQEFVPIVKAETGVNQDQVVARLMLFDRNGDGKVATAELSERMQVLVSRGDTSGDGALDNSEIRALTLRQLEFVPTATQNRQFGNRQVGGYSFGDTVGLSTRTHIHNTIEDLRLAPVASDTAKLIAMAFADQLESTALANLKKAIAPMLTEEQLAEFERNIKGQGSRTIRFTSNNGTSSQVFVNGADPRILIGRYRLLPEELSTATAAIETFKTDQQLDDARRSALVAQLKDVLTAEESDNFLAALARRPVVQTAGMVGGVVGGLSGRIEVLNQLRNAVPVTTPLP